MSGCSAGVLFGALVAPLAPSSEPQESICCGKIRQLRANDQIFARAGWWFCVASECSPTTLQGKAAQSHPPSPSHLPGDAAVVPSMAAQVGAAQLQLLFQLLVKLFW